MKPGLAFHRRWVDVVIEVDIPRKLVTSKMNDRIILQAVCSDPKASGHFGIYMSYERGTRFSDVEWSSETSIAFTRTSHNYSRVRLIVSL